VYASSWDVFSGGDWLWLKGANDDHLFFEVQSDAHPATATVFAWAPPGVAISLGTAKRDPTGFTLIGPAMRRGVLFAAADGDAGVRLAIGSDSTTAPTLLEPRGCLSLQAVQVLPEVAYVACFLIWMDPSIDYFRELFRLLVFCVRRVKTMSDFEMNATADQPDMRGLVTA
jgi:hypothetical protein